MKAVTYFALAALLFFFAAAPAEAKTAGKQAKKTASHSKSHKRGKAHFVYKDKKTGRIASADVVDKYHKGRIVYPLAKADPRLDKRMVRAATIAQERARAHSKSRCWHYVKNALLASGVVSSRPKTVYAKQAGDELVRFYGFKKLAIRDPYQAPVGAVLVYGARRAAGHVEIRTTSGFVSDFRSRTPSKRRLIGVYAKA
ncbi:MAG TPA: hypothetical protein VF683_08275 [Chthoniobacterales bacterium]